MHRYTFNVRMHHAGVDAVVAAGADDGLQQRVQSVILMSTQHLESPNATYCVCSLAACAPAARSACCITITDGSHFKPSTPTQAGQNLPPARHCKSIEYAVTCGCYVDAFCRPRPAPHIKISFVLHSCAQSDAERGDESMEQWHSGWLSIVFGHL